MSFRFDDPYGDERTDRERLLAGTETLSEGSQRLGNTHRIALEAEDMGIEILRNLRGQRETIENTRDTVSLAMPLTGLGAVELIVVSAPDSGFEH